MLNRCEPLRQGETGMGRSTQCQWRPFPGTCGIGILKNRWPWIECQVQLKPNVGGAQIDEYWNNIVLGMALALDELDRAGFWALGQTGVVVSNHEVGGTIDPYDMITGARKPGLKNMWSLVIR